MNDDTQQPLSRSQFTSILLNFNSAAALIEAAFITANKANATVLAKRFAFLHRLLKDEMEILATLRDDAAP